jgi:DNA polymerase III alpha subunit
MVPTPALKDDMDKALERASNYASIMGPDNFFIELQDAGMPEQTRSIPA